MKDELEVSVIKPDAKIYTIQASSVSSTNENGKFDILKSHANFISLVKDYAQIVQNGKTTRLEFGTGVLHCKNNQIKLFVGI